MLRKLDGKAAAKIDHFALAIVRSDHGQNHCGICFRDGAGDLWLLHLAWHYKLKFKWFPLNYKYLPVKRHRSILKQLAIQSNLIKNENPKIPYGFNPDNVRFERDTGKLIMSTIGRGLTCASFITAVLESQGLSLLKFEEWPEKANQEWQSRIVEVLEATPDVDPNHLASVKNDVGAMRRFTPEEVVGAGNEAAWPVGYRRATTLAAKVQSDLI